MNEICRRAIEVYARRQDDKLARYRALQARLDADPGVKGKRLGKESREALYEAMLAELDGVPGGERALLRHQRLPAATHLIRTTRPIARLPEPSSRQRSRRSPSSSARRCSWSSTRPRCGAGSWAPRRRSTSSASGAGTTPLPHTPDLVTRGLELHQAHSLSVWDGLIVQAALDARCDVLLSEDLQHGRRFGSLEVSNPSGPTPRTRCRRPPIGPAKTAARSRKTRKHG